MPWWRRTSKVEVPKQVDDRLPPKRISTESDEWSYLNSLAYIETTYASMANTLPFELYDYVELVAMYNPDYSQAVDNIKNLANPGFKVLVNSANETKASTYRARLKAKQKNINARNGGFKGIVRNLLTQGAIYGAMCGEWVLDAELSDVIAFAFVNPKSIRFFWDAKEGDWHPYQKVSVVPSGVESIGSSYVRLNTNTFYYQAIYTYNNNPYGIPPLIAALENIGIQREMINNMKSITKKLGMLGILEVIIERLPIEPDETPLDYMQRCNLFLENYQGLIQNMVNEGGVAHFDDTKVENLSIAERTQGAQEIFSLNEEQIFSGLHSLPSVQGRSYSTTETYAGVAYELLLRSVSDFTDAVGYIMEKGCWLMDRLWNIGVDSIEFEFGENKSLNRLQTAQTEAILFNLHMWMWENGLLDQTQVGQRHGIDVPAKVLEVPVSPPQKGGQTMMAEVMNSIYKNAVTMKDEFNPNEEGRKARDEYTAKLHQMYRPVEATAKQIIDETIAAMS